MKLALRVFTGTRTDHHVACWCVVGGGEANAGVQSSVGAARWSPAQRRLRWLPRAQPAAMPRQARTGCATGTARQIASKPAAQVAGECPPPPPASSSATLSDARRAHRHAGARRTMRPKRPGRGGRRPVDAAGRLLLGGRRADRVAAWRAAAFILALAGPDGRRLERQVPLPAGSHECGRATSRSCVFGGRACEPRGRRRRTRKCAGAGLYAHTVALGAPSA